jgi:hypothetical protein
MCIGKHRKSTAQGLKGQSACASRLGVCTCSDLSIYPAQGLTLVLPHLPGPQVALSLCKHVGCLQCPYLD